jgi:hypothetical protein
MYSGSGASATIVLDLTVMIVSQLKGRHILEMRNSSLFGWCKASPDLEADMWSSTFESQHSIA